MYDVHAEFLAQAADEDFDRVRVTVEILIVKVLDKIGAEYRGDFGPLTINIGGSLPFGGMCNLSL